MAPQPLNKTATRLLTEEEDEHNQSGTGRTGYEFYNYSGTTVKFCISDDDLDEHLSLPFSKRLAITKRSSKEGGTIYSKVLCLPGVPDNQEDLIEPVFREHYIFEQQMLEIRRKKQIDKFEGTRDFIEEEPLTIDLKLEGVNKQ